MVSRMKATIKKIDMAFSERPYFALAFILLATFTSGLLLGVDKNVSPIWISLIVSIAISSVFFVVKYIDDV